jgi:YHS domain-containing protein
MLKSALILCIAAGLSLGTLAQETNETQGNDSQTPQEQQSQTPQEQPQTQQDQTETKQDDQSQAREESNAFNSVCPVDGQQIDSGIETIRYGGKEYGFDSPSCALVFSDNPELYAGNLTDNGQNYTHRDLEPEDREGIEAESEESESEETQSKETQSEEAPSQENQSQENQQ